MSKERLIRRLKNWILTVLWFNQEEREALMVISNKKSKTKSDWYLNNVGWSLLTITFPFFFTLIHLQGGNIAFNKSLLEILFGGSLSLTGFNIIRSASNAVSEKLDESGIYKSDKDAWNVVKREIITIKTRLTNYGNLLSFVGGGIYVAQAMQIIDTKRGSAYWFLIGFLIVFFLSVVVGRLTHLMNMNFVEQKDIVMHWYKLLESKDKQMLTNVGNQARSEGL
jgi:hypothetical protein